MTKESFRCSFASPRSFEDNLRVREHKVFDKIEEAKPLTIEQGSQQAVFGAAQCTKALSQENDKYKCSGRICRGFPTTGLYGCRADQPNSEI